MATELDGPNVFDYSKATWGSVFDCLRWNKFSPPPEIEYIGDAEATGTDGSLMVTGKAHIPTSPTLGFGGGLLNSASLFGLINNDYYSEFIGKSLTPSGQSWGSFLNPINDITYIPRPPLSMSYDLMEPGQQFVDPPPGYPEVYWYDGVEAVQGFIDHT